VSVVVNSCGEGEVHLDEMLIEFIWFWMIKEYIMIAKNDLDQNDKRIVREKVVQQLKDRLASCLSLIYTQ
jgi:hypothetical protein